MFDYLIDHAQKNVYCSPNQDFQSITQPMRVSPTGGVRNQVRVTWYTTDLPVQNVNFHVYQIGQIWPLLMGLVPQSRTWINFADVCGEQNLIVDLYAATGIQMPRYTSWYMVTPDKNLILAVQFQPSVPINLDTDALYLRVYKNAYYNSSRYSAETDRIAVVGQTVGSLTDIMNMQAAYNALVAQDGAVYAFVNGYRISDINPIVVAVGDCVEYVYDTSIYKIVDFNVGSLLTFNSILDGKAKYMLHYSGGSDGTIDYQDDVDMFLFPAPDSGGRFKGVYHHKNAIDAMRMLTHRDYAVVPQYLTAFATPQGWTDLSQLVLRLHIRKSGFFRPLIFENNRILELYKLPDAEISAVMLGIDSNVPNWQAATLENAGYTQIMRAPLPQITRTLVQNAYGYNAISRIIGYTPGMPHLEENQPIVDVPVALQTAATAFEYDTNGLLLSWFPSNAGPAYATQNQNCTLVEIISGEATQRLDEVYGTSPQTLDTSANYRMYTCPIVNGIPNNVWVDVTGSNQYTVINGVLTWVVDPSTTYTMVRSDKTILVYELALRAPDGLLQFTLQSLQLRNFIIQRWNMQVPMGELDLTLNGHALVPNIDYVMQFPQIVILAKQYMTSPVDSDQQVVVRFCGHAQSTLTPQPIGDIGWVKWGRLSDNNRYDIRDDRVMHMTVGGAVKDRSQLLFGETDGAIIVPDAQNGSPYQIRDIIVPMRGLVSGDTYSLRAASEVIDQAVSDYLTLKLPEVDPSTPNAIPEQWPVYSPFCSKILYDLMNGVLVDNRITGAVFYSDQDVREICAPYEYLLAFDPTQINSPQAADLNYEVIQPHILNTELTVSIYIYQFIQRVINVYLFGGVNLSHWLAIAPLS